MFRSTKFAIESRQGLEDQSIESVLQELSRLGAPDIPEGGGDRQRRSDLARYLSDWHLVAFLGTTQLISQVCSPLSSEAILVFMVNFSVLGRYEGLDASSVVA